MEDTEKKVTSNQDMLLTALLGYISYLPDFTYHTLRVSKVNDAIIPSRKNTTDAGIDLYCNGDYVISPNSFKIISTGIKVELPSGFLGLIKPKGNSNHLVGSGVIDESYQGEVLVKVFNVLSEQITFTHGTPFAQLVLIPTIYPIILEVKDGELFSSESNRGNSGGIVSQLVGEQE